MELFRFAQGLISQVPVPDILAEKFLRNVLVSETLPTRDVAPDCGHSLSRQTWNWSAAEKSTPTVASFCNQVSGRQVASVLPVKRCTSTGVMNCITDPGAKEL